jgi:hypothetical protein
MRLIQAVLSLWVLTADPAIPIDAFISRAVEEVPGRKGEPTEPAATRIDGILIRQRSVQSKERADALRAFFTERFVKAGLYLAPELEQMQGAASLQVTGLDYGNMTTYTAILQPNPKGTTIVMTGADMGHVSVQQSSKAIAPVYPGGGHVTTAALEGTRVMSYAVQATPNELAAFYREQYVKAGYKEDGALAFVKGAERATVTVAPGLAERNVMVQVEAASPEAAR